MDTEKQRQRRRDDARLTESGSPRREQLNTHGAYRVTNPTAFGLPEWIRTSKARLVFRYEISDLFDIFLPTHTHTQRQCFNNYLSYHCTSVLGCQHLSFLLHLSLLNLASMHTVTNIYMDTHKHTHPKYATHTHSTPPPHQNTHTHTHTHTHTCTQHLYTHCICTHAHTHTCTLPYSQQLIYVVLQAFTGLINSWSPYSYMTRCTL